MFKPRLKGILSVFALSTPLLAAAGEVDTFCDLSAAQAESEAKVLAAPSAFANVGDPSISNKVVSVGLSKSLSQSHRAGLTRDLAAAECDVYRSTVAIKSSVEGVPDRIEQKWLASRIRGYEQASRQAERNLATEKTLLEAKESTLSEFSVALELRDRLAMSLAAMNQRAAELGGAIEPTSLPVAALIAENSSAQARAAELAARIKSTRGWDVNVLAGYRHDFSSGSQSPFIGLTAAYSFGYNGSTRASEKVGELTAKLLAEQRDGGLQRLQRMRQTLQSTLATESLRQRSLEERNAAIQMQITRASGVDTQAARRLRRNMAVEEMVTLAELKASGERVREINSWLDSNKNFE